MIFVMDKPNFPEKQTTTWGTWEELLLACAVHRLGTQSWDSVATELRKRSSNLHLLTPHACKRKFNELRRRFSQNDSVSGGNIDEKSPIPWLNQLRQLRLDELRHELERYDLSIVSLQSKVEKLKQVREQSLRDTEKSDLDKTGDGGEEKIKDKDVELEIVSPEKKDLSCEDSVRDDRSFDESNTTDPKPEVPETGVADMDKGSEPAEPAGQEIGTVEKSGNPGVEDSCNGSSDSVAKEPVVADSEKGKPGELRESVAESKGGEEGTKESQSSSEVQSSASLSRKGGPKPETDKPVEPDQEDQSPAMQRFSVESQPLVDFLGILRSHKFASFFERRLESQEAPAYTNMIRQHVDFEMVQTRLEGGWYSRCSRSLFFRDLLLICNNAIVFFAKKSAEYKAACELRSLVSKEMALQSPKQDSSPKEETPTQPAPPLNPEIETSDSLLAKSKLSLPLNACRKRSSIAARASTSSSGADRKKEQTTAFRDVKPAINWKQKEESSDEIEKLHVSKKRRKERLRSSSRNNSSKNARSRSNSNSNRNSDANANANVGSSRRLTTSNENSESNADTEKKSTNNASGKKQSAANFLSRMKRTSSTSKGALTEKSKSPESNSKGRGTEQRKNGNGKGNAQKDQTSRRGSGGRQGMKEQGSPEKKSVGRPSKRRAAAPTTAGPAKRAR